MNHNIDINIEKLKQCDKLINRFIFESQKFVWYAAFQYGKLNYLISGEKSAHFVYDFEYFAFTKSTKTLLSIKALFKSNKNEDVLILLRSIFENYISCRYYNENDEMADNFIFAPVFLSNRMFVMDDKGQIIDRDKNKINVNIIDPKKLKLGKDKTYFYDFYDLLCRYAHCNYGIVNNYLDEKHQFTLDKNNEPLLTRLYVIFVFTRLFEHVVTVDGEDFVDRRTEKRCYKLVEDSLDFQKEIFDKFISFYSVKNNDSKDLFKKWMKEMLKNMKKANNEEVGSVIKNQTNYS
jgi:hypothetical protein